jgi:hypothetical protein
MSRVWWDNGISCGSEECCRQPDWRGLIKGLGRDT